MDVVGLLMVAFVAGMLGGVVGVGGGVLFVPALVLFADLGHVEAEATSLLAIVPVAIVGAWRQKRYGNLDVREGATVGMLAIAGALVGVIVANAVPERALEVGFGILLVFVALQLARNALRRDESDPSPQQRS